MIISIFILLKSKHMSFYNIVNNYVGKVLPFFSLLLFAYQFICNYFFFRYLDVSPNTHTFNISKYFYYFYYAMSLLSFLMTYITEPGYVTDETNEKFLYLYKMSRKYSLQRANIYNEHHNLIKNIEGDDNDLYSDHLSSEDDQIFEETEYQNNLYKNCKKFRNDLGFDVKKCRQCHIIKACGTMHCNICHKCVYMQDHHCIWFNQCIGQFNLKYFIDFNIYLFLGSLTSLIRMVYYIIYQNYSKIINDFTPPFYAGLIACIVFDIVYIGFSFKLLLDQYNNLSDFSLLYDRKREKFIEIRERYEMACEIFGSEFGINWFLPFKAGGFYGLIKNKTVAKSGNYSEIKEKKN